MKKLFVRFQTGDVDIYIRDIPIGYSQKHSFGPYFHMATSMKKLILVAERNIKKPWVHGDGRIIEIDENSPTDIEPSEEEVFIGVYSKLEESKRGHQFYFSLRNRIDKLRDSVAHVVKMFKGGSCI